MSHAHDSDTAQIDTWLEEQAAKERELLDAGACSNPIATQERWLLYKVIALHFREKDWSKPSAIVEAAKKYGSALRRQEELSTALHAARCAGAKTVDKLDREHSAACDELGAAEHELLVCGAVVGGWTREHAEESV